MQERTGIMTTPIIPRKVIKLAKGRGFAERPWALVAVITFLQFAIALLCASASVFFNDRWITIVFEDDDLGITIADLWVGVWVFLILGIAFLATAVLVIGSTIKESEYASSMLNNTAQTEDEESSNANTDISRIESGFYKEPGPVVAFVFLVVLSSAILSASLTQWLVSKSYGLQDGIFKGVWGGVYVFFALGLACLGVAIAVAVSKTKKQDIPDKI